MKYRWIFAGLIAGIALGALTYKLTSQIVWILLITALFIIIGATFQD